MPLPSNKGKHHHHHQIFNRSFDTTSQSTNDSSREMMMASTSSFRNNNRRTSVPYVNERREFDPRYDPRKPETTILLQHQPERRRELFDDEDRVSPDHVDRHHHQHYQHTTTNSIIENNEFPNNNSNHHHRHHNLSPQEAAGYQALHNQRRNYFGEAATYGGDEGRNVLMQSSGTNERAIRYFEQQQQQRQTATIQTPVSNHSSSLSTVKAGSSAFPRDARLVVGSSDRPFDESSNSHRETSSTAEIDSLDEVLEQDSYTTETTGEDSRSRFQNVLSAIEEHPSLEAGSLSYSFTQRSTAFVPSMRSTTDDSESDNNNKDPIRTLNSRSRSRSPLDTTIQQKQQHHSDEIFRNQPATNSDVSSLPSSGVVPTTGGDQLPPLRSRQIPITTPEKSKQTVHVQSVRPPRTNTWDTSNQSSAGKTIPETPSAASSSCLTPIQIAQQDTEKWLQSRRTKKRTVKSGQNEQQSTNTDIDNPIAVGTSASTTGEETDETLKSEEQDLMLHDLCGESSSTDDVAWRNALHVLSIQPHLASVLDGAGWTPLHVACLGSSPPPLFMTRSLLYVYGEAARKVDGGGRLPLHLVAASSGDVETMQLLTQVYPQAVYQADCQGWTPLHLILKNFSVDIHLSHCRVLLGLVLPSAEESEPKTQRVLQRRGEHLSLPVEDLDRVAPKMTPVTHLAQEDMHELAFTEFPLDVQASLRRLCQWKRKQRRQNIQTHPDDAFDVDSTTLSLDAETNPAAHFTPVKRQLPIHIVLRRGLSESRKKQRRDFVDEEDEEDRRDDNEEPTSIGLSRRFYELVRLFIAFYPEALIARDFNGHTPLLTALSMTNAQPSLELVELLLGKRTSGYDTLPKWAQNMPLYHLNSERYLNPAMIPCKKSHQLPLHVVAEEMASNFSMLLSVHGCYPGAIQCQDARGRTPLHILLRNYRRSQVDPSTIALLLSDNVAQTLDDEGKLPFDLLVETARNIPLEQPYTTSAKGPSADDVVRFKKFFQGTIIASSEPNVRNRLDSNTFLWRLRSLPPWLRRQACSATFVQELLIEELASPLKCALILLYAALLCTLIVVFRIQVQIFINDPETTIPAWLVLVVYTAAGSLLVCQLTFWSICVSMSEFLHLCVCNIWRWIDLSAFLLVCIATTMLNYLAVSNEAVLAVATGATGLLWFSAVGFLASWWFGASLFVTSVRQIARLLFWPLMVTTILIVSFSQMFYTVAYMAECNEALGGNSLCSVRENYQLIYFLFVGEPIVDMENDTRIASSVALLAVLFITILVLFGLSIMAIVILLGSNCDYQQLAVTSFWEHKLTFVIFACGKGSTYSKTKYSTALETSWSVACNILSGRDGLKGTYWYARFSQKPAFVKACCWLVVTLLVPIWVLAGFFTLGLLWPPQVRRFLFRPQLVSTPRLSRGSMSQPEVYASQMSSLRNELTQIRDMSYERSNDLQRDLRHLKEILHLAMAE